MTVPSDNDYDPSVHLSVNDISDDNSSNPLMLCIRTKQSKMDPFHKGIDLFVGKTNSAVSALLSYLCIWGMKAGPLSMMERC